MLLHMFTSNFDVDVDVTEGIKKATDGRKSRPIQFHLCESNQGPAAERRNRVPHIIGALYVGGLWAYMSFGGCG